MRRGRWGLLVVAGLAVGIAMRMSFLFWSPLPATLDGFGYARLANEVLASDSLLSPELAADQLGMTLMLAVASEITGVAPLYLAQPLVACLGGGAVIVGAVLVRSIGRASDWPEQQIFYAAGLATLGLAVSGLYLRRTGVPDEEAIGLLIVPLLAIAAHRLLVSPRPAWAFITGLLWLILPPLHNLTSLVGAFTVSALVAVHIARAKSRRDVFLPLGLGVLIWGTFFGYYGIAPALGLELSYSRLIRGYIGAFIAWFVGTAVLAVWLRNTSAWAIRGFLGVAIGGWFLAVAVNAVKPVFPGTITTPPLVLGLVLLYLIPVGLLIWEAPRLVRLGDDVLIVVALLIGPLALGWYFLTTSLSPAFFGGAIRVEVFAHVAAFVVAAVGALRCWQQRPAVGRVVVLALIFASVLTAPLAFVHLDTGTAPRTIHPSEFEAVTYAGTGGTYASDHRLAAPVPRYSGTSSSSIGPTRTWLAGGPAPDCPTVAQRSWTTSGAHFFPGPPETLARDDLASWLAYGNVVYSVSGTTETYVVVPAFEPVDCRQS